MRAGGQLALTCELQLNSARLVGAGSNEVPLDSDGLVETNYDEGARLIRVLLA